MPIDPGALPAPTAPPGSDLRRVHGAPARRHEPAELLREVAAQRLGKTFEEKFGIAVRVERSGAERIFTVNRRGFTGKLFPRAGDGLIDYIKKSKTLYVVIPLFLTLTSAISVAFLNNWLTKRKNGGKDYFPGEGKVGAASGAAQKPPANAASAQPGGAGPVAAPLAGSPLRRPVLYDQFARQRAGGATA